MLNGISLSESSKLRYLGLNIDDLLTWKHHISELSKKLNMSIGILFKMNKLCPKRSLMSLYFSLVHSYLSYGTFVWGNANETHLNKIRVLQKKVVRIIANVEYNNHSSPL